MIEKQIINATNKKNSASAQIRTLDERIFFFETESVVMYCTAKI